MPGERTKGSAKQVKPVLQGKVTNLPATHCAKPPLTHAFSPSWHAEFALSDWNFLFNACASLPFCNVNAARLRNFELYRHTHVGGVLTTRDPDREGHLMPRCEQCGQRHLVRYHK